MVTQDPSRGQNRPGGMAQSGTEWPRQGQVGGTQATGTGAGDQGVAAQVQQQAGQVVEQAGQKVSEVKEQVVEQATSRIEQGKDQATDRLGLMADAIRQTGGQLRDRDQAGIAQYVDRAADQIENLSSYLSERNLNQLMGDVERFARREPTLFLGGAFLLGLVGARFLKSSGQGSQGQGYGDQSYGRQNYGAQPYRGALSAPSYSTDYARLGGATPPPLNQGALHDAGMADRPIDLGQATGGATRPSGASAGMAGGMSGEAGRSGGLPTSGMASGMASGDVIVGGPPITDALVGGPPIDRPSGERSGASGDQGRERS